MWKLFGKEEDENYIVSQDVIDTTQTTTKTASSGISENQIASAAPSQPAAPVTTPAPDFSAPVLPPADSMPPPAMSVQSSAEPVNSTPIVSVQQQSPVAPVSQIASVEAMSSSVTPPAAVVGPQVSPAPHVKDPMDALTPSLQAPTTPAPVVTDEHAAQVTALDATPVNAAVPGIDSVQAVMDHTMSSGGGTVADSSQVQGSNDQSTSNLMGPGVSHDGPPVPGVTDVHDVSASVQNTHDADADLALVQHVLTQMANDPNLTLEAAVVKAHETH